MSKKMFAPVFSRYVHSLGRVGYRNYDCNYTYDDKSYKNIDKIYEILNKIKPVSEENNARELWLKIPRGQLEDYGDFEQARDFGDVNTIEEFKEMWLEEFPNEYVWFNFVSVEDPSIPYRAIFIENKHVLEVDSRKEMSYPNDISEFTETLLNAVTDCYNKLVAGTYNDEVNRELPPEYKTGTILRSELWKLFPESKDELFDSFSAEDLNEFKLKVSKQTGKYDYDSVGRLSSFTANEFYLVCSIGYAANNYNYSELTPKEQYYKHADGRDDGLKEIPPDSPEAFLEWYEERKNHGGHPWEVCRGGNSTHVSLFVVHDDKGYALSLAGKNRTVETVKFYLALTRAGYPVFLHDAEQLVKRFDGTEKVGVVPRSVFPRYCDLMFPGEDVISFINLPYENENDVAQKCVWQELDKIELL